MGKFKEVLKHHFLEILRTKTSPLSIATGFFIGTFLAILPTFGLGALIGLLFLSLFEKISKFAMLASFVIWNPFVLAPIFASSIKVGTYFIQENAPTIIGVKVFNEFYRYTLTFIVGNVIIAITFATISFCILFSFFYFYYRRRELKLLDYDNEYLEE